MRRVREWIIVAGFLAAAIAWVAWPLPRTPGTRLADPTAATVAGVWGRVDLDLLVWILAWDAHALATAPAEVFQANILYPGPLLATLARRLPDADALATRA